MARHNEGNRILMQGVAYGLGRHLGFTAPPCNDLSQLAVSSRFSVSDLLQFFPNNQLEGRS